MCPPEAPTTPAPSADASADVPFCPECGYDLRGSGGSDRCPECGVTIDRERLGVSRIPWSHRQQIGRVRAYWRTVLLATFRTRTLAAEVARPVDYRDAQRFRLVTATIAVLTLLSVLGITVAAADRDLLDALADAPVYLMNAWPPTPQRIGGLDVVMPLVAGALVPLVVPLGIVSFALMVTGVGSYWFHPRSQPVVRQNRAVALSYYACAPLAFLPLLALAVLAVVVMAENPALPDRMMNRLVVLLALLLYVLVPLIGLAFYAVTLRLLRGAAGAGPARMWAAAVMVPLTWLACAGLALFALPWVVGFFVLLIDSLR